MSHEATTWAIRQRGLRPTTRIVLWHLCDRFNPDYGCFPSQDRLAHDCEISRSTLNEHLALLEAAGLLRRVPRLHPVTKRQMPTRYILGFEPGFAPHLPDPRPETGHGAPEAREKGAGPEDAGPGAPPARPPCPKPGHGGAAGPVSGFPPEPCPEIAPSRVRKPDTNLVREPLREPVKEEEGAQARAAAEEALFADLLAALGLDPGALPGWWQGWPAREHIRRWQADLGLTPAEILATARASRADHPQPPDGPKALDRAMARAARRGTAARPAAPPQRPQPVTDLPAFYADWVNSDRHLPASAITNTMRDTMLARHLVTPDRLRARGIR